MVHTIVYTEKAIKCLESLNRKEAQHIHKKIESIKENPLHYINKLVGINLWKLRIGDYRAVIRFDKVRQEIAVIDIGHRKSIYKKL